MAANSPVQKSLSVVWRRWKFRAFSCVILQTKTSTEVKNQGKYRSGCLGHCETSRVGVHLLLNQQHPLFWVVFCSVCKENGIISDQLSKLEWSRARLFIDFLFDYEGTKNTELFFKNTVLKPYWRGSRNRKH